MPEEDSMTPEERLREIAEIFAQGLLSLHARSAITVETDDQREDVTNRRESRLESQKSAENLSKSA